MDLWNYMGYNGGSVICNDKVKEMPTAGEVESRCRRKLLEKRRAEK